MRRARYDRILASTALALTVAVPFGSVLTGPVQLAAAPPAGTPFEQARLPEPARPTEPATALPAHEPRTAPADVSSPEPAVAAEPTTLPDPLASLDPADRAIAERLRDLLATKADRLFANKNERAATIAFYENRNLAPLWLEKGVLNARAEAVIGRMKAADADGLDPTDYKTPNFAGLGPDALAEAELKLTRTVLTYARHLQAGRASKPRRLSAPVARPQPLSSP